MMFIVEFSVIIFSKHISFLQTLPRPSSFNHFINNALWVGFYKTENISEDIKVRNLLIAFGAGRRLLLGSITNRCMGKEPALLPEREPDSRERWIWRLCFFASLISPFRPRESDDEATGSSYLSTLKTEQQPF